MGAHRLDGYYPTHRKPWNPFVVLTVVALVVGTAMKLLLVLA